MLVPSFWYRKDRSRLEALGLLDLDLLRLAMGEGEIFLPCPPRQSSRLSRPGGEALRCPSPSPTAIPPSDIISLNNFKHHRERQEKWVREKKNVAMMTSRYATVKMASNGHPGSKLDVLQDQLEGFIEHLRTVGVIAGDFQQNGQSILNDRL